MNRFTSKYLEFFKYSLVGASGFVIDFTLLNLFIWFRLPIYAAATISLIIAASSNWYLNRIFTFKAVNSKSMSRQWVEFLIVSSGGLLINFIIFYIGYEQLDWHHNLAKIVASLVAWIWNFFANKYWTFRQVDR
ncbi:MAG: GtrA family protein [Candidatus Berkelbacteria bacterium Gr01-1014_85]|uniref:GtrA family protein n=1 Tax=Candidatus Berkelbacteria bacterium Gr01-1014_85 TaxID=2017150 RepID=A0A554JCQ8_9BACT|nr:MAG: GtrA family protein [Candidatus Berkelbacteria bacterium Gr01-1014_85]